MDPSCSTEPSSSVELRCLGQELLENDQSLSWDLLPDHIWENILAYLPILTLFQMKKVSSRFNSIVLSNSFRSASRQVPHPELYFVLFADYTHQIAAAYNPKENQWVRIHLPSVSSPSLAPYKLHQASVSNGALLVVEDDNGSMGITNLFTRKLKLIPPMICSRTIHPYILAIIDLKSSFKVVAVCTRDNVYSQMYDSETNSWTMTGLCQGRYAMFANSVYLDGFLFCLSHGPEKLLYFDLGSGLWGHVSVAMPAVVCSHLLVHLGTLVLIGGVEEIGVMTRIGIWELDNTQNVWTLVCFMPDHLFAKLGNGNLNHFHVVDRQGKICLCKRGSSLVLMYDLSEKIWCWLPPCPFESCLSMNSWFGQAVEPRLDALS